MGNAMSHMAATMPPIPNGDKAVNATADSTAKPAFAITHRAAQHLLTLPDIMAGKKLRVMVEGGGCAGFQYIFSFTDQINQDDVIFTNGKAVVVIDTVSLPFLQAGELDYQEKLMGSFLTINNPNAKSGCGCGTSFSVS